MSKGTTDANRFGRRIDAWRAVHVTARSTVYFKPPSRRETALRDERARRLRVRIEAARAARLERGIR